MLSPKIETIDFKTYRKGYRRNLQYYNRCETVYLYIQFSLLTKEEIEYIKQWINKSDTSVYEKWVIELKSDGMVAGTIAVNSVAKNIIIPVYRYDYWGNGYVAEALKAISDYLLNSCGYYLVECSCNEFNKQSSKVILKAGFKKDGYIANRRLNTDYSMCKNSLT